MSARHARGRNHAAQRRHPPNPVKANNQPRKSRLLGRVLPSRQVSVFDGVGTLAMRTKLNRHMLLLTGANLLVFAAWMFLRSIDDLDAELILGMAALTLAVWCGLAVVLSRRLAFWLRYERR